MIFYGTVTAEGTWYVIQADNTPTIERSKYLTHPDICLRWGVGASEDAVIALAELLLDATVGKEQAQRWARRYATEVVQQLGRMWVVSQADLTAWIAAQVVVQ